MNTLAKRYPASSAPQAAQESAYPRTWMWEEDGNIAAGSFVRFDSRSDEGVWP